MKNESKMDAKKVVREAYDRIARDADSSCCDSDCGCGDGNGYVDVSYEDVAGYHPEADLGLGCGLPLEYASLQAGETVVDLGSGAGNDAFVAAETVGPRGRVIGIDMTESMVMLSLRNAQKLGMTNVDFRLGDIEDMPVRKETADLVISNCVLNLVPDKAAAFGEMYRILKPGGRFTVSDIVIEGDLPRELSLAADIYAACIGGAVKRSHYLNLLDEAGFENITVVAERNREVPKEMLGETGIRELYDHFIADGGAILSITVRGYKPVS
jgi:SAM-dependent methyltransferase